MVVDNLSTHTHPAVQSWLARHPRVTLHFTPTSGSWLKLVEAFFSIITRQALRRVSLCPAHRCHHRRRPGAAPPQARPHHMITDQFEPLLGMAQ